MTVHNKSIASKVRGPEVEPKWCKRRGSDRGDAHGTHHSATLNEIGSFQFGVLQCAHVLLELTTGDQFGSSLCLPAPPSVPQRNALPTLLAFVQDAGLVRQLDFRLRDSTGARR